MPENIPKHTKLLVISDTGMFYENGLTFAFGPVVKELTELDCFERIVWVGFNRIDQIGNKSYLEIKDPRISTKFLSNTGGKSLYLKLFIILRYPVYILKILKEILKSNYIHIRAPSHPAVITMFLSYFFPKKKFWFKYAGDWKGKAPFFYSLQRRWLKKLGKNSKITVNGIWPEQPDNILGFENPCLDAADRASGKSIIASKNIHNKIDYCFVGGLNENKGSLMLLKAIKAMDLPDKFGSLHIVGSGHMKNKLQKLAESTPINIIFHGSLPKDEVVKIYKQCHFLVLPSKSEGFPKVVGEAMNFGCVPIVSDISCIDQYVKDTTNGILIAPINVDAIINSLSMSMGFSKKAYREMIVYNFNLAERFTYDYYKKRIVFEIYN